MTTSSAVVPSRSLQTFSRVLLNFTSPTLGLICTAQVQQIRSDRGNKRYVANVQKTSFSITTISDKTISQTTLQTLDAVLALIPALTLAAAPHGSHISISGVGSNGDSNFIDNDAVSMYDDPITALPKAPAWVNSTAR